jgi:hypothetical protein
VGGKLVKKLKTLRAKGVIEKMPDVINIPIDTTPSAPKAPEVITFAPKTKQQPKLEFDSENA